MNGQFTLSDDSHGVEQVGVNYDRVLCAIRNAGIEQICFLERPGEGAHANGEPGGISTSTMGLSELESHPFFSTTPAAS